MWFSMVYILIDNDTCQHSGQILTTLMTRIIVDKSIYHAKPHSICFLPQYQRNEIFVLTTENTDSDLKVHTLHYANELLVHVRLVQKLLQTRLICRNNSKKCLGKEKCGVLVIDKST